MVLVVSLAKLVKVGEVKMNIFIVVPYCLLIKCGLFGKELSQLHDRLSKSSVIEKISIWIIDRCIVRVGVVKQFFVKSAC